MSAVEHAAPALLDAACEEPTLDEFMRRDPALLDPPARERMAELLRQDRARYIKAQAEKKG